MTYSVVISDTAIEDLRGIFNYISNELFSPDTAKQIYSRLYDAIMSLDAMPHRFHKFELWNDDGMCVRYFPVSGYSVFYAVEDNKRLVTILRVLYGKRDFSKISGKNNMK